jgi:hypothetical protein
MRLTFSKRIGSLRFRRYQHERYGIVETLTKDTVTYVRPAFGLLGVTEFTRTSRSPSARVGASARALATFDEDRHSNAWDPKQGGPTRPKPRHRRSCCGVPKHSAR